MKVDRIGQAFVGELRSAGIYVAAVGFFAAGYLCHMSGSADNGYLVSLLVWYRTPITLAVLGLPALLIINMITSHVLELRTTRIQAIETAEKNIAHQHAQIEQQNTQLIARQTEMKTLVETIRRKQLELIERERTLNEVQTKFHKSATAYTAWADKVAAKVRKTSTTLVGDAAGQAPDQIEQLQLGAEELLTLLNKKPGETNEK
jgi:ABC-type transport system involved in cytochrome bd biosynthesis fused ATPase/permease subunit